MEDKINSDGLSAYDIMRIPNCPVQLPVARSMTQAAIDYRSAEPAAFRWYELRKEKLAELYNKKKELLDKYRIFGGGVAVNTLHQEINIELEAWGVDPNS